MHTNKTIAVERNLTPITEYLAEKGYRVEVVDFGSESKEEMDRFDALVITGMNKDFLGISDTVSKMPIINADGLTKEDVYNEISSKFKQ